MKAHETLTRAEVFNAASQIQFKFFAGQKHILLGSNQEFIMIVDLNDKKIKYTSKNGHVHGEIKFSQPALENILPQLQK